MLDPILSHQGHPIPSPLSHINLHFSSCKYISAATSALRFACISAHLTLKNPSFTSSSFRWQAINHATGYHRRMVASSKVIRVGPWGGHGGSPWDDGPHRGVRSITVTYGRFLESMRVEYADRYGRPVLGEKHGGGTGRSLSFKIELDFPYELVTGVSGCYHAAHGGSPPVVRSLTFATSRGIVHGPFGDADADGVPFSYPMEGGVVVGFTGRSGWHLDALGLYVAALRAETLCGVVQERGLMAYRSFVYGDGAAPHQDKKKPFKWCYK